MIVKFDDVATQLLAAAAAHFSPTRPAVQVAPEQPSPATMAFVGDVHRADTPAFEVSIYGNTQNAIVVQGVPFAQYWQRHDADSYVFHPMVWGRYIAQLDDADALNSLPALVEKTAHRLPNGGLAIYYPRHYPLNRMRGSELVYSAISQSEILCGLLRAEAKTGDPAIRATTDRVLAGLLYPFENGGVNLSDVAFLELPLFRANPEVILNGWLHALLNLNDLALARGRADIADRVARNLAFFATHHLAWYDSARHISRYSDTCPLRVEVEVEAADQSFAVYYDARSKDLPDIIAPLSDDPEDTLGSYVPRVTRQKPGRLAIGLTASGLFDTVVVSDRGFRLRYRTQVYAPENAAPRIGADRHERTAEELQTGLFAVRLGPDTPDVICGYPTNFSKANHKNFYHGQHIIALAYLSKFGAFENAELKSKLMSIALEWRQRTAHFTQRSLGDFEPLNKVLAAVNRGKFYHQAKTLADLRLSDYSK